MACESVGRAGSSCSSHPPPSNAPRLIHVPQQRMPSSPTGHRPSKAFMAEYGSPILPDRFFPGVIGKSSNSESLQNPLNSDSSPRLALDAFTYLVRATNFPTLISHVTLWKHYPRLQCKVNSEWPFVLIPSTSPPRRSTERDGSPTISPRPIYGDPSAGTGTLSISRPTSTALPPGRHGSCAISTSGSGRSKLKRCRYNAGKFIMARMSSRK
jgi:hypothetical protein